MTKSQIIDAVNHRLQQTTIGRVQIAKLERDAPLVHALIAVLLEVIDSKESRR